jgi:hypothetical protein
MTTTTTAAPRYDEPVDVGDGVVLTRGHREWIARERERAETRKGIESQIDRVKGELSARSTALQEAASWHEAMRREHGPRLTELADELARLRERLAALDTAMP